MTFQGARMKEFGEKIKNYYSDNNWIQYVVRGCLIVGILMLVMPFVFGAGYTYLCEDDFSFEAGALDAAERFGQIRGAFDAAHRYYIFSQGTYFANFVWHFVRPYMRWGLPGFHAVMIANVVVFALALSFVIKTLCKDKTCSLCVMFLTFLAVLGTTSNFNIKELLFWYTGTVNFTWELSFSMISLILLLKIKAEEDKKKQWMLAGISVVTALIGSGGALMITAVQCSWLLIALLMSYDKIKEKKIIAFPFLCAFVGALWNVVAPGNFDRVAEIDNAQDYTVWNAIVDTLKHWKDYTVEIFGNPLFVLILALLFLVVFVSGVKIVSEGINHIRMLIVAVGMLVTQYLTAFPVMLGYCGRGLHNMRTAGTYELIATLTFAFGVICFGQWSRENIQVIHKILPAIAIIVIAFGLFNGKEIKMCIQDGYAYNLTKELLNGTVRDVYKVREATLSQIDSASEGEDVVVHANAIPSNKSMYGMGLVEDPEAFVNESAAGLFRVNSIIVTYE